MSITNNNKEKSVIILGAGSSYNYGYPLGEGLRNSIIYDYPNVLSSINKKFIDKKPNFVNSSQKFIEKFKLSSDISIDLFLSKFPEYAFEGKIAIVHTILKAENQSVFLEELRNRKKTFKEDNDDWLWHMYVKISKNLASINSFEEINFDDISFITFNYDRILEHYLYTSFTNGFNFEKFGGSPEKLLKKIKIEHVYGKVVDLPWESTENENSLPYRDYTLDDHKLHVWSDNIRVIYERTNINLSNIHSLIKSANKIFFLGFGYDAINLKILGFPQILPVRQKVFGTGYQLYSEEIEKIKNFFPNKSGAIRFNPIILNSNCTELLRRFFL